MAEEIDLVEHLPTAMGAPSILRPLDPAEAFFFMADRVSCMNFVIFAERSGHLEVSRVRAGLQEMQAGNSLLRTRITWTDEAGLCFAAAPDHSIALQCREVNADDWQADVERELARPFAAGEAPLIRCLYLQMPAPERSVLALCCHHSIADGRSAYELLRVLLDSINSVKSPLPAAPVAPLPPMYELFPPRFRWAEEVATGEQVMDELMADYQRHGRLTPLPWLSSTASTRQPRILRLIFPPEVTRALRKHCQQRGTTLHGVLGAAQLMAHRRIQPVGEASPLFLSCPVDMRAHLQPLPPTTPSKLYVSVVSAAYVVNARTELWELACEIQAQTRRQLTRGEAHLFFSMYGLEALPIRPDRLPLFTRALLASWHNTMLSNIGQLATIESDPAVENISFALCPMPYQTLFNAASSYGEQLILNLAYDAGRLTAETANALAEAIRHVLRDAAGTP